MVRGPASEAVTASLRALHDVDAATGAVAWFHDERALADADLLDRTHAAGGVAGPLHGLPVTVKDWIDVEGFPCAGESEQATDRWPGTDATVVSRLRAAGAVVVAKTRAWSLGAPDGVVRHPVDPARTPGGSSTGEAVVAALGASAMGIGSDSGGSVRLPAAWCGVFGLKPTTGRVPTTGHYPVVGGLSDGRTQIGPLARGVDDTERLLAVICGPDCRDAGAVPVPLTSSTDVDLSGASFAVVSGEGRWQTSASLGASVEEAAGVLETAGLRRVGWSAPWLSAALGITRDHWRRDTLAGSEVDRHLTEWDRFRTDYLAAAEHVDLLLTPVTRETAPAHRELTGEDFVFTLPASLTGSPAIAVPFGRDADGLPLSVQIVGRPWEDPRVLAAARLLEPAARSA
jgi:amidase